MGDRAAKYRAPGDLASAFSDARKRGVRTLTQPNVTEIHQLRRWLEYVISTGIEWLDQLDAASEDLEDDELSGQPLL